MESTLVSPVVKSFLAGMFSGTCSTFLFQPLDLVKTRLQCAINVESRPLGMLTVFSNVVQQERVVGLWKGLVPSISRSVPGIGIYFSSIHFLKSHFEDSKKPLESMLIGGSARSTAVVTMLPFTVLKIRYESGEFRYKSMYSAMVKIYQTEGMKSLYSGLSATVLRDVPFSGFYFMFYTQLKTTAANYDIEHINLPFLYFTCGVASGMLASVLTQPADVIKTHMQLYPKKHGRLKNVIQFVYSRDGIEGFWRGIVPRTIRRTLMAALAWTVYEEVARRSGLK